MAFKSLNRYIGGINKIRSGRQLFLDAANNEIVKAQIIDANQKQMRDEGIDSKGESLGEYSDISVAVFGKRAGHIQLYDTGAFYRSMHVVFGADSIFVSGDMQKPNRDLAIIYPEALGLTEENQKELTPEIKERMMEMLNNLMGNG